MLRLVERSQRLALRMNQRQFRRQQPKNPNRGCLVVDEDAALAVRRNLPPQQDAIAVSIGIQSILRKHGQRSGRRLEDAAYNGLIGSMPHPIGRSLAPEQQGKCVNQNRLARACFSCQQIQPAAKRRLRAIDHRIVFRPQLQQHRRLFAPSPKAYHPAVACLQKPEPNAEDAEERRAGDAGYKSANSAGPLRSLRSVLGLSSPRLH